MPLSDLKSKLNTAQRVKIHTASSHQALEKTIISLIRGMGTVGDYTRLLGFFYSYFSGIEGLVETTDIGTCLPDFRERRKASWISVDLLALGAEVPETALPTCLPEINNFLQAFGALYVIEGSTLGGIHIVQMIQKKLPFTEPGYRFFSGYGNLTMPMWEKFTHTLNHLAASEDDIKTVLSSAENTFKKFGEWINSNKHGNS